MTTIISRKDGRYEIRESAMTSRGPRSRTLAIFKWLSSEVLDHAHRRASRPFDDASVRRRAEEIDVPWVGPSGAADALSILAMAARGGVPPVFVAAIREAFGRTSTERLPDTIPPMLDWVGVDDEKRGRAVRDVLGMADAILRSRGGTRRGPTRFPPLRDRPRADP